jgi:predicted secreted hydrolase
VERIAREAVDLAGSSQEEGIITISLGDWSASIEPHRHILRARADDIAWEITLMPVKAPVLHGDSGYSRKGEDPEKASCYYSLTRLQAEGTLTVSGRPISVRGTAWMDHEFSSSPLDKHIVGWDWLSLQFSNNSELMIYMLRKGDGSYSESSSGTFVNAEGKTVHLQKDDFSIEVLDHWKSPRSGALYPSRWRIAIPSLGVDITIHPNLEDQELETPNSTRVTYWEGSVTATGEVQNRRPVSGVGYVELTGYAGPLNALR